MTGFGHTKIVHEYGLSLREMRDLDPDQFRERLEEVIPQRVGVGPDKLDREIITEVYQKVRKRHEKLRGAGITDRFEYLDGLITIDEKTAGAVKEEVRSLPRRNRRSKPQILDILIKHGAIDLNRQGVKRASKELPKLVYDWKNHDMFGALMASSYTDIVNRSDQSKNAGARAQTRTGWLPSEKALGGVGLMYLGKKFDLANPAQDARILIISNNSSNGANEAFVGTAACRDVCNTMVEGILYRGAVDVLGAGKEGKGSVRTHAPELFKKRNDAYGSKLSFAHTQKELRFPGEYTHAVVFSPRVVPDTSKVLEKLNSLLIHNAPIEIVGSSYTKQ